MWLAMEYFLDLAYDRIPVMIVLGDYDDIMVEHGLEMQRKIKGSRFCVLPRYHPRCIQRTPGPHGEYCTRVSYK
jgi:hypothetical protein